MGRPDPLLLLRHLAGELARSRLLVVATFREPAEGPLANPLPALLRTEGTRPIRLTGLSRSDIAQWLRLLETGADVDGLAGRLWAGSGGDPLFVRMLVERGQVADDDPRGFPELRQLALAHLGGLDEPARDLLDTASVLGERIDPPVLAEDAGLPDILAAAALVITGMGDPETTAAVDTLCGKAMRAVPAEDTALRARLRARQSIVAAETGAGNRARKLNARTGARPFLALSRLGLARTLLAKTVAAQGNPVDLPAARMLVTEAAAEFRQLALPGPLAGADALLTRIDSAARAASPVSPREAEVAELIARAMTNRQIAEQFVLSERTVETHVRGILGKLGYTTRTEIATWSLREAPTS